MNEKGNKLSEIPLLKKILLYNNASMIKLLIEVGPNNNLPYQSNDRIGTSTVIIFNIIILHTIFHWESDIFIIAVFGFHGLLSLVFARDIAQIVANYSFYYSKIWIYIFGVYIVGALVCCVIGFNGIIGK